jgi:TubC N-terminal docking domain
MSAALLKRLRESGIVLWASDGKLHYQAEQGALTAKALEFIKANKQRLLAYLALPGQRLYTEVENDPAGRLAYAFELALSAGFPELKISGFETVPTGAENWRRFVEHATTSQLHAATEALEDGSMRADCALANNQGIGIGQSERPTDSQSVSNEDKANG